MKIRTSKRAKTLSDIGSSKGGRARASVLSKEERSEIARAAVRARWAKAGKLKQQDENADHETDFEEPPIQPLMAGAETDGLPFSMFPGVLNFGPFTMECHVLSNGKRVFTQREIVKAISGGRESGNLKPYLHSNPLIDNELAAGGEIRFKIPGLNTVAIGREATTLIEICEKFLEARDQRIFRTAARLNLAAQSEIIIRVSAKIGIIALVDEATGYQKVRADNALRLKLQAFIAEELQEWARKFPPEFWYELARLEGIKYSPRNRPLRWGKYIMAFVYDAIDKDVGQELRKKNPNPRHGKNHHQWLKEFGKDKLIGQIQSVITIMKLCDSMDDFRQKFDRVFSKSPVQYSFDDVDWKLF